MVLEKALLERIRFTLKARRINFTEKKMFGGVFFMKDGKILVGSKDGHFMVRIDPNDENTALKRKGTRPSTFTGRYMKGYLYVDHPGFDLDKDMEYWVSQCMKFNPNAKSSKKSNP
ncbi:MAG: TfoX/Sxy family protein [Saprospiraceae bacterium]